jgi:hypothetical protein
VWCRTERRRIELAIPDVASAAEVDRCTRYMLADCAGDLLALGRVRRALRRMWVTRERGRRP